METGNKISRFLLLAVGFVCLGTGCQKTTYHWGNYEPVLYSSYAAPGEVSEQEQIALLEEDIAKAAESGKPVPPGLYADLGNLYFKVGDYSAARAALETEKRNFPESQVLIDRMLQQIPTS